MVAYSAARQATRLASSGACSSSAVRLVGFDFSHDAARRNLLADGHVHGLDNSRQWHVAAKITACAAERNNQGIFDVQSDGLVRSFSPNAAAAVSDSPGIIGNSIAAVSPDGKIAQTTESSTEVRLLSCSTTFAQIYPRNDPPRCW